MLKKWFYNMKAPIAIGNVRFFNLKNIIVEKTDINENDIKLENGIIGVKDMLIDGKYDFYFENLHIQITDNDKDKIVKVFIKPGDMYWSTCGIQCPKHLVYMYYYVTVMDDTHCGNQNYNNGYWSEYVIKTLKKFSDTVIKMSDEGYITDYYKNIGKNNEND